MDHQIYKIIWHNGKHGEEIIDACDSLTEAQQLLLEYKVMLEGKVEIRKEGTDTSLNDTYSEGLDD